MVDKKPTTHQNGHINHGYTASNGSIVQNGRVLTIPEIKVVPPSINEPAGIEPETEQPYLERRPSDDLNQEESNALSFFNKILDEQNTNVENNPDNMSTCSTDSESDCSQEHHIEAVVHQEDSEEYFQRSTLYCHNEDKMSEHFDSARSSIILTDKELGDESSDEIPRMARIKSESQYEEIEARLSELGIRDDSDDEESKVEAPNLKEIDVAKSDDDSGNPNEDASSVRSNSPEKKVEEELRSITEIKEPEKLEQSLQTKEANSEPAPFIPPPPPPISGLLDLTANAPTDTSPTPTPESRKKYRAPQAPFITPNSISEVILRETPKSRKRTESSSSNDAVTNVTPGSIQYNRIKAKLDKIFRERPALKVPDRKSMVEDRTPSPLVATELELIDQVLDQFEAEIPADFAKTKEFKESLNNLLMRKQSNNSARPSFAQKYQKNNENATKIDEAQVEKQLEELTVPEEEKQDEEKSEVKEETEDKENDHEENEEENIKKRMATMRLKLSSLFIPMPKKEESVDDKEPKDDKEENKEPKRTRFEKRNQPVQNTPEKDKEEHKKKMVLTLRSIKLKKTGIPLNEDVADEQNVQSEENTEQRRDSDENKQGTDKDEHKRKMLGTLRSIKLRRTGIPLNEDDESNDKEPSDTSEKASESEDSKKTKAIEEHRRRMMGTLRSIQLRKTGISLSEDDTAEE